MTSVDEIFAAFVREHRAGGEADPRTFIARAQNEAERRELIVLIEAYLQRSPGRRWDPEAFATSKAARVTDSILAEWELEGDREEESVGWAELLPALRTRARIMRRELVARLAQALDASDQVEKVGDYYHRMELEELPVDGISNRVLEALGSILGESAETLRRAGRVRSGGRAGPHVAFSRTAYPSEEHREPPTSPAGEYDAADTATRDRVDELFTGGPDADAR